MANTRIKIKRVDLIAKLQDNRAKLVVEHAAAVKKAIVEQNKSKTAIKLALNELFTQVDSDYEAVVEKISGRYGGTVSINLGNIEFVATPVLNTSTLDQMIRVLEASCDETISVAVGDSYSRYL